MDAPVISVSDTVTALELQPIITEDDFNVFGDPIENKTVADLVINLSIDDDDIESFTSHQQTSMYGSETNKETEEVRSHKTEDSIGVDQSTTDFRLARLKTISERSSFNSEL